MNRGHREGPGGCGRRIPRWTARADWTAGGSEVDGPSGLDGGWKRCAPYLGAERERGCVRESCGRRTVDRFTWGPACWRTGWARGARGCRKGGVLRVPSPSSRTHLRCRRSWLPRKRKKLGGGGAAPARGGDDGVAILSGGLRRSGLRPCIEKSTNHVTHRNVKIEVRKKTQPSLIFTSGDVSRSPS